MKSIPLLPLALLVAPAFLSAQTDVYDSGGELTPEQAAYDILFNDLSVTVSPSDSSISGVMKMEARIVAPTNVVVLDLDPILEITSVSDFKSGADLDYERRGGRVWVSLVTTAPVGEIVRIEVDYNGRPRIAPRPPWSGGFTWATTPAGDPWIATTAQQEGPDIWWPTKDHPSDEADSTFLHITVPEPLVVATNGRMRSVERHDGTATYNWFVSTPINSYNVALNIAPYRVIEDTVQSIAGDWFPVQLFVLPESYEQGLVLFQEILQHLSFFERHLGPYPFRADKYGAAMTPHLGMEHQTIIAYGADFDNGAMTGGDDWGFDALHHHEMSHEWWGNMVTDSDWKDMWLHEGFGSYMQPLYLEETRGPEAYHAYMESMLPRIANDMPTAPRGPHTAKEIYTGDIYFKGAWVLHTLRHVIGDSTMAVLLHRFAYPDPAMEHVTDGRQTRFADTDEFIAMANDISGMDLDWFFEVYLRRAALPALIHGVRDGNLYLQWDAPDGLPFSLPVDVQVGDRLVTVPMRDGQGSVEVPQGAEVTIDPDHWILRAPEASGD